MGYKDIKPYNELMHNASLHGGPQKYIEDIEANSFAKGITQGRIEGIKIGGSGLVIALGIGKIGKILWDKYQIKKQKEKKLEEDAKEAKNKIMESIQKNDVKEQMM